MPRLPKGFVVPPPPDGSVPVPVGPKHAVLVREVERETGGGKRRPAATSRFEYWVWRDSKVTNYGHKCFSDKVETQHVNFETDK